MPAESELHDAVAKERERLDERHQAQLTAAQREAGRAVEARLRAAQSLRKGETLESVDEAGQGVAAATYMTVAEAEAEDRKAGALTAFKKKSRGKKRRKKRKN